MEILVQNLSKKFRQEFVIRQFNYTFQSRNSYAITGPNGSGKSTLLQLLAQFTLPNTGTVEMSGVDPDLVYSQITYAAPYVELIEEYTLQEHLELLKKNKYLPSTTSIESFEDFIDLQPNRLKLIKLAVSLGSTESLAEHPATMTHAAMTPAARAAAGIFDGLLRLSVGIEATDDLLADLSAALARAEAVAAESKRRLADA